MGVPRQICVIIPTFNRSDLLGDAIASVLSQPGFQWQIIVADDGSTDDTARLVTDVAAAGQPITLLVHPENRGVSAARNTALRAARMPLIAFLDSDDVMVPGSYEAMWDILNRHPEVDIARGQRFEVELTPGSASYAFALTLPPNGLGISGTLMRAALVRAVGPFNENLRRIEDTEWFARVPDVEQRMALVNTVTMHRRHGHDNLTGDVQALREARLAWVRSHLDQARAT